MTSTRIVSITDGAGGRWRQRVCAPALGVIFSPRFDAHVAGEEAEARAKHAEEAIQRGIFSSLPRSTTFKIARNKMPFGNDTSAIWNAAIELEKESEHQQARTPTPAEVNAEIVREKLRCSSSFH